MHDVVRALLSVEKCVLCVSTLWGEMSVVLLIGGEYVHDVHDELEQLGVETLLLPQRCTIRGKLWEVSSLWWLKKEIDEQFNVRWFLLLSVVLDGEESILSLYFWCCWWCVCACLLSNCELHSRNLWFLTYWYFPPPSGERFYQQLLGSTSFGN